MKRLWWKIVAGVTVVGLVAIAVLLLAPKDPIPNTIKKQVTSTVLIPRGSDSVIDRDLVKYDSANKLLTFQLVYAGKKIVVSEQPTPDQFVDIPQVYTKLIDGMNNYQSFDAAIGTVNLTLPKELNGKQAAVMNGKGTLLFAKPDANLSSDEWRRLFKNFTTD